MKAPNTSLPPDPPDRPVAPALLWIPLTLLVYALSTGPAVKLSENGVFPDGYLERVYAPLVWLAEECPPAMDFFEWYLVNVWGWHPWHHG